jgi:phosphoglycolate phosphatase-like HAD superfamily hydrolase
MAEVEIPMTAVQQQNLVNEFSAFYAQMPVKKSYIYSGVRDILEALKIEEYPLVICINKPIDLTYIILDGLNLNSFYAVIGGESLHEKKIGSMGMG